MLQMQWSALNDAQRAPYEYMRRAHLRHTDTAFPLSRPQTQRKSPEGYDSSRKSAPVPIPGKVTEVSHEPIPVSQSGVSAPMTTEKLVQMNFTPEQQMIAFQKREEAAEQRERDRKRVSQLLRESTKKDPFGTGHFTPNADRASATLNSISPGVFPMSSLMNPSTAKSA